MIIARDFTRSEQDDIELNVLPILKDSEWDGAHPLYDEEGTLTGWIIKPIFE